MKKPLLTIFILFQTFLFSQVYGQLGNYWTLQVSTEGTLLSGALVAANSNNAGFFYNPASMSSDSSSSFSFNTSLFRTYFLKYKNPFGEPTKLVDVPGNFDPIFLSFLIPRKNKLNVKLGVSLMGKQNVSYKLLDRIYIPDYQFPGLDSVTGNYEGIYSYILRSSEYWGNFSFAKQLSNVFSIGATLVVAYRSFNYINDVSSNYVSVNALNQNSTSSFRDFTEAYMYNYKVLAKVGIIFNLNKHSRIGLNLTTSSLNIFGRGTIQRSFAQTNIVSLTLDTTNVGANDQLISDFGAGLKANYKSPLSIALGYNFERGKQKIGIAFEFFNGIDAYNVIEGENLGTMINTSKNNVNEEALLSLSFGQRRILNIAVSYEQILNEKFTVLTGFRTNFSMTKNVEYSGYNVYNHIEDISIDFYHLTGGSTFTFLRNKFIAGVDLGFSFKKNLPNIINYTAPLVINDKGVPLQGNNQNNTTITNIMLGLVLGYSFSF